MPRKTHAQRNSASEAQFRLGIEDVGVCHVHGKVNILAHGGADTRIDTADELLAIRVFK